VIYFDLVFNRESRMHQPLLPQPPTSTHLKQDNRALSVEAKFEAV
jgi:hypothetical protein